MLGRVWLRWRGASTAADRAAADLRGGGRAVTAWVGLLCEKPLPRAPSRRAAGVWVGTFLLTWFRLKVGAVSCSLSESTAADRAVADMRRVGMKVLSQNAFSR